jgi:hypothetical protein
MWNQYDPGRSRNLITERAWRGWWWCLLEVMTLTEALWWILRNRGGTAGRKLCGCACQASSALGDLQLGSLLFPRCIQANSVGFPRSTKIRSRHHPCPHNHAGFFASGESPKTASRLFSSQGPQTLIGLPHINGTIWAHAGGGAYALQKASIGEEVFRGLTSVMLLH